MFFNAFWPGILTYFARRVFSGEYIGKKIRVFFFFFCNLGFFVAMVVYLLRPFSPLYFLGCDAVFLFVVRFSAF